MHFRAADCRGGRYGTDQSGHAHPPHDYHKWGELYSCTGWTDGEANAAAAAEAIRRTTGDGHLEAHPAVLTEMTRLLLPDSPAEMNNLPLKLTQLYGMRLVEEPSLEPGQWRIMEDPPESPAVGGQVPRLEGDNIIFNWHHKRP
jgi:hypothetical protein